MNVNKLENIQLGGVFNNNRRLRKYYRRKRRINNMYKLYKSSLFLFQKIIKKNMIGGNIYSTIVDPVTKRKINIDTNEGTSLLLKYINK